MAFDPVRDAILNSPERVSYPDPFDNVDEKEEREQQEQSRDGKEEAIFQQEQQKGDSHRGSSVKQEGAGGDDDDSDEEDEFEAVDVDGDVNASSFKAPTAFGRRESNGSSYGGDRKQEEYRPSRSTSHPHLSISTSPDRPSTSHDERARPRTSSSASASTSYFLDVIQTPGHGTPGGKGVDAIMMPPTPGSSGGGAYESVPMTPGGVPSTPFRDFNSDEGANNANRPGLTTAHRQSSIFSLLSPEPPEKQSRQDGEGMIGRNQSGSKDHFGVQNTAQEQGAEQHIRDEPEEMELEAALPVTEDKLKLSPSKSAAEARRSSSAIHPNGINSIDRSLPVKPSSSAIKAPVLSAHEQLKRRVLKPSSSLNTNNRPSSPSSILGGPLSIDKTDNHSQRSPASIFSPAIASSSSTLLPQNSSSIGGEPPSAPVVWRRPYAPLTRINGPPGKSFYVPLNKREWEFYKDGRNSKNPLRSDRDIEARRARQSPFPGDADGIEHGTQPTTGRNGSTVADSKGKQREDPNHTAARPLSSSGGTADRNPHIQAQSAQISSAEHHISPAYSSLSPLHPSLIPDPVRKEGMNLSAFSSKSVDGIPRYQENHTGIGDSRKRKRGNGREGDDPSSLLGSGRREGQEVAAHYNKRQNFSREERTFSPIIGLKSFNNWVKSVLIAKFARFDSNSQNAAGESGGFNGRAATNGGRTRGAPIKVLDLGCGKGGDLMKWQKAGLSEYVGIDIADISIDQARDRWQQMRGPKFEASFYAFDCFSNPLSVIVPRETLTNRLFDTVTMQFCMHYAFQSVSKARMMLENVSRYLKKGGTFLGTIPDSEQLLSKHREIFEQSHGSSTSPSFGNSVYQITFEDGNAPSFGHRYTFFLTDAVENVPEYVVPWAEFEVLAAEYGLKLLYHATFHELYEKESEVPEFKKLLEKMKVVNAEGESELTEEQWEACNIYVAFAFVRV